MKQFTYADAVIAITAGLQSGSIKLMGSSKLEGLSEKFAKADADYLTNLLDRLCSKDSQK